MADFSYKAGSMHLDKAQLQEIKKSLDTKTQSKHAL